ncbi:glycosyltransferase family 2 protein [Aliiroseovarius sp. S2029]|uniref:glycosyltransferase family 2 protein n=1 Tax=Aliiroseovarius sp. S2029 TaxID=2936988 RepID=UPI0020C0C9D3|nr:glycosyltransferase family 2 protein [Aliiroseovarius sp. S2029]
MKGVAVPDSRKVLFSAVKNEAPFILEWIAYHRVIGFDRIIICSNDCDDGTDEILSSLARHGIVEHLTHEVPIGVSPQLQAAQRVSEAALIADGDWVLWLDGDEFLNVRTGTRDVASLVAALGGRKGILINWRLFGDSGQIPFAGRLISNDFTMCSKRKNAENCSIKTLFRQGDGIVGFQEKGVHRPKIDPTSGLTHSDFLNGKGNPLSKSYAKHKRWLAGQDIGHDAKVLDEEAGFGLAQINHYVTRTPEMFWLKQLRGRGWAPKRADGANNRHTAANYAAMNHNETRDESILFWENQTTDEIASLLSLDGVAEALRLANDIIADRLSDFRHSTFAAQVLKTPEFELTLPTDEANLVRDEYSKASSILEYGSGGSTFIAAAVPGCRTVTVESDWNWSATMRKALYRTNADKNVTVHWVDIGPTGPWGRPKSDTAWANYPKYALEVWDLPDFVAPDVVLIDGRFRVACFLACLFRCKKPTRILWDDYVGRENYYFAERYLKPSRQVGRMAVFDIEPTDVPADKLLEIVSLFSDME